LATDTDDSYIHAKAVDTDRNRTAEGDNGGYRDRGKAEQPEQSFTSFWKHAATFRPLILSS